MKQKPKSPTKRLSPLKPKIFAQDQQSQPISQQLPLNQNQQFLTLKVNKKNWYEQQFDSNTSKLKFKIISVFFIIAVVVCIMMGMKDYENDADNPRNKKNTKSKGLQQTIYKSQENNKYSITKQKQQQKQPQQQQISFTIAKSSHTYHNNPDPSQNPSLLQQQQKQTQQQNNPKIPQPWQQQKPSPSIDKYFLKHQISKVIELSRPDRFFGPGLAKSMAGMTFNQLEMSIRLLQVVHCVNFKGEVEVEPTPYDKNITQKQTRVRKLLQMQEKFFQLKYSYKQDLKHQLPFCIVVPSYNNVKSRLYLRNLDSMLMQNYQNYHIVYIDDASPDQTGKKVKQYIQQKQIPKQKIKVIINQKNIQALNNIYNAIHFQCQAGEIVAIIDGDDSLIGREVLGLYNSVYQRTKKGLVYSNYLHIIFNQKAIIGGSSRPIPYEVLEQRVIRRQKAFATSHLLTFYVDLFRKIKKQDLTYQNGTFFRFSYDVAICTPMIQMLGTRVHYISELTYEYRFDTGQNDPTSGQQDVTSLIYSKDVYNELRQFPFITERQKYLKTVQKYSKR